MELHIVRLPETPENKISSDEWLAIIDADPDLVRMEAAEIPSGWVVARLAGGGEWDALRWRRGTISSGETGQRMMDKMLEIATKLSSVVMSDDGMVFKKTESGEIVCTEDY